MTKEDELVYITKTEYEKLEELRERLKDKIVSYKLAQIGLGQAMEYREDPEDFSDYNMCLVNERNATEELQEVEDKLARAIIVEKEERVCIGDMVSIKITYGEEDPEYEEFVLIGDRSPDMSRDVSEVSVNCDCGKCILGKNIGDINTYEIRGVTVSVEILDINGRVAKKGKSHRLAVEMK